MGFFERENWTVRGSGWMAAREGVVRVWASQINRWSRMVAWLGFLLKLEERNKLADGEIKNEALVAPQGWCFRGRKSKYSRWCRFEYKNDAILPRVG